MIAVAIAAVVGVALGLFMRSALFALIGALASTASIQTVALFVAHALAERADQSQLAATIQSYAGDGPLALLPTAAAAGLGALVAAGMMRMSIKDRHGGFWLPDSPSKTKRQKIRFAQAIQERPSHLRAESRIDKLLKQ